ncbi:MAG: prevent-host-death protein [Magnetococcales bacterium]|nr:prevent-host-death protein [Magnetococcales bacterium]
MEYLPASRSVSLAELRHSPDAVLVQAGLGPVAILEHDRPTAYILSPHVFQAMLERLGSDLRLAIQEGIASGPSIPAELVFAQLNTRYADDDVA